MATQEQLEILSPNALLILSVIDVLSAVGGTRSPKSDMVGWLVHHDASWVHRHGKDLERSGLATLSLNGHCFLSREGQSLGRRLRADAEANPAPERCSCGGEQEGPCVHGRQLYACGRVMQWCPDHVPGSVRAELSPRSRRAHHEGIWFGATDCGLALSRNRRDAPPAATVDGTPLVSGMPVVASHGGGARMELGDALGTVLAAAGASVLVSWPASRFRPAVEADIMRPDQLVMDGELDYSGLSDYQNSVICGLRDGTAVVQQSDDGTWAGTLEGRAVNARTMAILFHRGLLPVPVQEPAVGTPALGR